MNKKYSKHTRNYERDVDTGQSGRGKAEGPGRMLKSKLRNKVVVSKGHERVSE